MKLIEPKVEMLVQEPGIEGMYKMIDRIAGTCYGRTELHYDSKSFVDSLEMKGHMRPLEFGTVYLKIPVQDNYDIYNFYSNNKYSKVVILENYCFVTTNYRVIVENFLFEDLKYFCKDWKFMYKRPCFLFTCSRAIADEFRTHITLSSMMKSTRYCKMNDLEICRPQWVNKGISDAMLDIIVDGANGLEFGLSFVYYHWWNALKEAELSYTNLINNNIKRLKLQQARGVLPLDMATQLCMCGFYIEDSNEGWDRFLKLRCDEAAHPDAVYLAKQVKELLKQ